MNSSENLKMGISAFHGRFRHFIQSLTLVVCTLGIFIGLFSSGSTFAMTGGTAIFDRRGDVPKQPKPGKPSGCFSSGCHAGGVRGSKGPFSLTSNPSKIFPGDTVAVTVRMNQHDGGFDLVAQKGTVEAGTCVACVTRGNRVAQAAPGTFWSFNWTAPDTAGNVLFDFSGVSAESTIGDRSDDLNYLGNFFTLTVSAPPPNNPPKIVSVEPGTDIDTKTGKSTKVRLTAEDEKPDQLTWNVVPGADFEGTLIPTTGTGESFNLTYSTPSCSAQMLTEQFDVVVTDDQGLTDTEFFTFTMLEDKAASIDQGDSITLTRTQGQSGAITLSAVPSKCEEKWTINGGPSKGSANLNGSGSATGDSVQLNYTAPSTITFDDTAQFNVQLTTSDLQNELIGDDSLAVFVNLLAPKEEQVAPVISESDQVVSSVEAGQLFSYGLTASDANGDSLTWSVSSPPAFGSALTNIDFGNNVDVVYTAPSDLSVEEIVSFAVQVRDSTGLSDEVIFNIKVTPKKGELGAPEIQGLKFINLGSIDRTLGTIQYKLSASDPDGDALNWFIKTQASAGDLRLANNGNSTTVLYDAPEEITTQQLIQFVVEVRDSTSLTDEVTFTATLNPTGVKSDSGGGGSLNIMAYLLLTLMGIFRSCSIKKKRS